MTENRPSERASTTPSGDGTPSSWWNRLRYGAYAPVCGWVARPFESGWQYAIEWVNESQIARWSMK